MNSSFLNLELFLSRFLEFDREIYKETHLIKQKLIDIEMLDISDPKLSSFFSQINNILPSSMKFYHLPNSVQILIKMKENSNMMGFQKLFQNNFDNCEIFPKFVEFVSSAGSNNIFVISKKKRKIMELFMLNSKDGKIDNLISSETQPPTDSKNEYSFFTIAEINSTYDFKKTLDFFKIWSIFNCDLNLIVKYFRKKSLKALLALEPPLLCNEIVKIFEVQTFFSLFSDNDCYLMNILEEQQFDFSANVYVNSLQFLNPLNIEESLYVFGKIFSFDNRGVKKQISLNFEQNLELKIDILMGTSSKIQESMFIFGFINRNPLFEQSRIVNHVDSFFNKVMNKILNNIDMKNYGYATFVSQNERSENSQTDFFKKIFLKRLLAHFNKKSKNHSIFLALNFTCDIARIIEFCSDLSKLQLLEDFLVNSIMHGVYQVLDQYKKENEFQLLMTFKEKKTLETFNHDLPRIAQYLENISYFFQNNFQEFRKENLLPKDFEINKKLWGAILFDK